MDSVDELKELAKKERLTEWQLGRLLEGLAKLIHAMPASAIRCIDETTEYGLEEVERAIKGNMQRLCTFQAEFDTQAIAVGRIADEGWKQIKAASDAFNRKIKNLDKMEVPSIYGLKDLLDIADRCSRYDDKQWQRVLDLARAIKGGGG